MSASAQDMLLQLRQQQSPAQQKLRELKGAGNVPDTMPQLQENNTTPLTDRSEWGTQGIPAYTGELVAEVKDTASDLHSLVQVGTTMATGAVSSITSAALGSAAMLFGRDPDQTTKEVAQYSEMGTVMPWGEGGQKLLEDMAVPLMKLEEGVTDLSWFLGMENPTAATMLKTEIMGALELLLPFKSSKRALQSGAALRRRVAEMKKLSEDLGVDMSQSGLATSIVELAHQLTPAQRAEHMPYLQESLKLAANKAKARKDVLYEEAAQTRTYVNSGSIDELASGMRSQLDKRYDLDEMPRVQKVFNKLAAATDAPAGAINFRVNLRRFEDVRKKINAQIKDAKVNSPSEAAALIKIKKDMDSFLDNELRIAGTDAGKSAISGDMAGVKAYKDARAAATDYYKKFNEDKVIRDFIYAEATPETMVQWIVGSSATGVAAKREAATVVARMKAALGDDHPAIQGIRADFLYEVASPLLHPDGPNFNTFVRNYELMVDRNPSLVEALNLNKGDFKELHDLARLQKTLVEKGLMKEPGARDFLRQGTTIISRLWVGHGIAKAGVKVNLMRDALGVFIGLDRVSQKNMFYELAGLKYGDVMLEPGIPLAAEFIAGAALTEIADAKEAQ